MEPAVILPRLYSFTKSLLEKHISIKLTKVYEKLTREYEKDT